MPVSAPRGSMTGAAPGRRIRRLSESRTERSQRFPIAGVVSGLCMHLPLWKLAVFLGGVNLRLLFAFKRLMQQSMLCPLHWPRPLRPFTSSGKSNDRAGGMNLFES